MQGGLLNAQILYAQSISAWEPCYTVDTNSQRNTGWPGNRHSDCGVHLKLRKALCLLGVANFPPPAKKAVERYDQVFQLFLRSITREWFGCVDIISSAPLFKIET